MVHRRGCRADREHRVIYLLSCPHSEVCMMHQTSQPNMIQGEKVLSTCYIPNKNDCILSGAGAKSTYIFEV